MSNSYYGPSAGQLTIPGKAFIKTISNATNTDILTSQNQATGEITNYSPQLAKSFNVYKTSAQTSTAVLSPIIYNVEVSDASNMYNTATGQWTVPDTGFYTSDCLWSGATNPIYCYLVINGTQVRQQLSTNTGLGSISVTYQFTAGDVVTISCQSLFGNQALTVTAPYWCYWAVKRIA